MLRGATTQMASWFYAMMRVLHHNDILKSTIHTLKFRDLMKNDKIRGAVMEIENEVFFKALYILLHTVFPAICTLCFTDSNKPIIDKIYVFSQRTETALEKSIVFLNDTEVIGAFAKGDDTLADEIDEVWGG